MSTYFVWSKEYSSSSVAAIALWKWSSTSSIASRVSGEGRCTPVYSSSTGMLYGQPSLSFLSKRLATSSSSSSSAFGKCFWSLVRKSPMLVPFFSVRYSMAW